MPFFYSLSHFSCCYPEIGRNKDPKQSDLFTKTKCWNEVKKVFLLGPKFLWRSLDEESCKHGCHKTQVFLTLKVFFLPEMTRRLLNVTVPKPSSISCHQALSDPPGTFQFLCWTYLNVCSEEAEATVLAVMPVCAAELRSLNGQQTC